MNLQWIPSIEVEGVNGTREVSLATHLLMDRKIFLTGEINSDTASTFIAQLLFLETESDKPITIYINSPGGEVNAGLLIYDALQGTSLEVNMVCTGMAASMAAVILCGGQEGRRQILPHSKVMIHEPLLSNGVGGSATSIQHISESILETRDVISSILSKHTGKSMEEIMEAIAFDNYMDAEKAIAFGICDSIVTRV